MCGLVRVMVLKKWFLIIGCRKCCFCFLLLKFLIRLVVFMVRNG